MPESLSSHSDIVRYLSKTYGLPYETVESLIRDWVDILYFSITGRSPNAMEV